jgi:hypothetical protein
MTIERVIDGKIYEFPAGTPEATIRRFTLNKAGTPDASGCGWSGTPRSLYGLLG